MNGRMVKEIQVIDNSREQTINVSALSSGVYMVHIYGNQANVIKRVIKN
jgi:hypothetical protein